jgi:hypothetical protein
MKNLRRYIERMLSIEAKVPGTESWNIIVSYRKDVIKKHLIENNYTLEPEDAKEIDELCENPYSCSIDYIYYQIGRRVNKDKYDSS